MPDKEFIGVVKMNELHSQEDVQIVWPQACAYSFDVGTYNVGPPDCKRDDDDDDADAARVQQEDAWICHDIIWRSLMCFR